MRPLWKALKDGGTVGITPDQQPKFGGGEFAPFFGKPALTLSLIPRLAERSGAPVLFAWASACPGGFEMHFEPAAPAIADADLAVAIAAMNTPGRGHRPPRPDAIPVDLQAILPAPGCPG